MLPTVFMSLDAEREYLLAKRFLVSQMYLALEVDGSKPVPIVSRVCETSHPCIARVEVDTSVEDDVEATSGIARRTFLCFTETMEVVDSHVEGLVDEGYMNILYCDKHGTPSGLEDEDEVVSQWDEERFLAMILKREQTLLSNFPHAIARHLHTDPQRFALAQRYVFCNSRFLASDINIAPWLSPLEHVANVILPRVYGSKEVFLVHCALGWVTFC